MSFKIAFKEKELQRKILVKGKFVDFEWNKIREHIIQSSKKSDKVLKDKDDFILEFINVPKNFTFPLNSVWNKKTYNFLLDIIKVLKGNNPNEDIKFKFGVVKVDKLPKWNLPKY